MKLILSVILLVVFMTYTNAQVSNNVNRKLLEDRYYTQRGSQGFETSQAYLQSVILTGLAGAILAILCCLAGLITCTRVFWRGRHHKRFLVKCSGKTSVTVLRVLIFTCAAGVITASIVGFVGNRLMSEGTREFMDTITSTAENVKIQERSITQKITILDPSISFTDLDNEVDRVVETANQAQKTIFTLDSIRVFAVFFALSITLVTSSVAFAAALLLKSKLSIGLFIVGFLMLFLLWWTYAVHLPISIFIDDICVSFDNYLNGKTEASGPLQYFVQCLQTGSYVSTLNSQFAIAQTLLNDLNATTTKYAGYSFDPTIPSQGTPEERLEATIDKCTGVLNKVEQVMAQLPSEQQSYIQPYVYKLQLIIEISQELLDLMQCSRLQLVVKSLKHSLCDTTRTGIVYILICNYLIGIVGTILTFLGIFAVRRFELGNVEYRERTLVQSISLIQAIIGFVAIATAGSGWGGAFIVGFFVIVVTSLGFSGAFFMNKILLFFFAIAEGALTLTCLGLVGFLSYKVATGAMGSTETKFTTDLVAIGIIFMPILIGLVSCLILLKNFDRVKAAVEGRGRTPSMDQLWNKGSVYGEGL